MNRRPRTVGPYTTIEGLLDRFSSQIEDSFPVVDKNQKLVGFVTQSDILHVLSRRFPRATVGHISIREVMKGSAQTVGEIMTKRPITLKPDMTLAEALNTMASHKLRHAPVVDKEKLVGLVCLRDIIELYRVLR